MNYVKWLDSFLDACIAIKKSTDVCYSYFCKKKVFIFKMIKSTDVCYDFLFYLTKKKKKIIVFYRIFLYITVIPMVKMKSMLIWFNQNISKRQRPKSTRMVN